ncbi:MAG TPA: glycosyltransferase [Polyangiaceae bacterium]
MEILLVTTELDLKLSALDAAEEILALAKTFRQLGHDVTILAPFDDNIEGSGLLVARRLTPLILSGGRPATVFDAQMASGTKMILLGLPTTREAAKAAASEPSVDPTALKAAEFAQGVAAFVEQRAEQPQPFDVVHLFGWPALLVAIALRATLKVVVPSIVLSIREPKPSVELQALPREAIDAALAGRDLESNLEIGSIWRRGVAAVDAIIAPSEGHIEAWAQLAAAEQDVMVQPTRSKTFAVVSGVDYARFNPATNPCLVSRYDAENADTKRVCKTALLQRMGLGLDERPLVLFPEFARDEAGAKVVLHAVDALLDRAMTFAFWSRPGNPNAVVQELDRRIRGHESQMAHGVLLDDDDFHRGVAAADFVAYAAQRAPGNAGHAAAQRYGAIVIGPNVPGLNDAIVNCDSALETGTGFLFEELSPTGLLGALGRAEAAYRHPSFVRLRRRVMRQDCSWDRPCRRLLQIYKKAVNGRLREISAELSA